MTRTVCSTQAELETLIHSWISDPITPAQRPCFVLVCDVGQGNLNVVINAYGQPFLYYDLGGGIGGNLFTQAYSDSNLLFCDQITSKFVLSHWDDDHISVAIDQIVVKKSRHTTAWLGPEMSVGKALSKIASGLRLAINEHGRSLYLWHQSTTSPTYITRSGYTFIRVTGNDPNNSGIALKIEDPYVGGRFMLLTGDASYLPGTFNHGCNAVCVGLVASHHGAEVTVPANIPQPLAQQAGVGATRTIAYSYGMGNSFGHPATEGVNSYASRGWNDAFRLDTAGSEPDADIGGTRGNIGIVWPNYIRGLGFAAREACVLSMQHTAIALIASCMAEIRLFDPSLAGAGHIAVAAAYQACSAMNFGGSTTVSEVMRRDGNVGGLARYTAADGGWKGIHQGYPMLRVHCLAVDQQGPPHVHAGCSNGVFRSIDSGTTWQLLGMAGHAVRSLAIEPGVPTTLYAGTQAGGLFKSIDGGAAWTHLNTGLANTEVRAIAVSALNTQHVFVGTPLGIYHSADSGSSWALANVGLAIVDVASLAVAHDTGVVYAGTEGGGLFASMDHGANWNDVNVGLTDLHIQAILVDPIMTTRIYVGTRAGVFRSLDGATTWAAANAGLVPSDIRALDIGDVGTVYAGTSAGVFRSQDYAGKWNPFNTGWSINAGNLLDVDVRALKSDSALPSTVYVGTVAKSLLAVADALEATAGEMRTSITNVATITQATDNPNFVALALHSANAVFSTGARIARIITNACAQVHERMNGIAIGSQAQEALLEAYDLALNPRTEIQARDAFDDAAANQILAAMNAVNAAPGVDVQGVIQAGGRAVVKALAEAMGRSSSKTRELLGTVHAKLPPAVAEVAARAPALRADVDAVLGSTAALMPATPIWPEASQPDNFTATVIAIDSNNSMRIYVGTEEGNLRVSADAGATWSDSSVGLASSLGDVVGAEETLAPIRAIAINPINTQIVYVATVRNGVFRSSDAGANWGEFSNGLTDTHVLTIAVDPVTPTNVYAGTRNGQLFRSNDSGDHWAPASTGLPGGTVTAIVIDTATPTRLYAGILGGGIYCSADSGGSWVAVNTGLVNLQVRAMTMAPSNAAVIYAGTEAGVYVTFDSGANWAAHNAGQVPGRIAALLCDRQNTRVSYAGTGNAGVFQSFDYGHSWMDVNSGLTHTDVTALGLGSTVTSALYAGTRGGGVFRSTGLAIAWVAQNTGLTNLDVRDLSVAPGAQDTLHAATAGGVFVSIDNGDHWAAANTGLSNLDVRVIVRHPLHPATLYAGTAAGVFRSTDSGQNWMHVNMGLTNTNVTALLINPVQPMILYAGTNGGVFKSADSGLSWFTVNNGLVGQHQQIRRLLLNSVNPNIIYAATATAFCRSDNGGNRWKVKTTGLGPVDICALSQLSNGTDVQLGTADGRVFTSRDRGTAWSAAGIGVNRTTVLALAVHPLDHLTVYAGTAAGGALKSVAGQAWRSINKGVNAQTVHSLAIDGLAPATLYGGTERQFVFKSVDSGDTWGKNVTVNVHARSVAIVAGVAAQVGVAQGMASNLAARAAVAAARVVVPAVYGAPQVGCHRYPSTCTNHVCALSIHHFNRE